MVCEEPDPQQAVYLFCFGQQVSQIGFALEVVPVGIDVLSHQRYLSGAARNQVFDLVDDFLYRPAYFPAPAVGHDAIGAEIITALDYGHIGGHSADGWEDRGTILFAKPCRDFSGFEKIVYIRESFAQFGTVLADETPCQGDTHLRASFFKWFKVGELVDDLVLRVFSYHARVDHDNVGPGGCGGC